MKKAIHAYEQPVFGALLTMTAGAMDAYSYLLHGKVFAGMQTGNLILLGIRLGERQFNLCWRYAISLLAFFTGTLIVRIFQRNKLFKTHGTKGRQIILLYQASLLILVAILGTHISNFGATIILSIAAAGELQAFHQLDGVPFTPLMMTGNLRTLAETTWDTVVYHESAARHRLSTTLLIFIAFTIGSALIAVTIPYLGTAAILIPAVILLLAWLKLAH
ncbi:YoaK family protein [Lapidilactobacillus bayanensis]|uniref:YoaK family protein n=1 Tax=Lapidilactobacillus bayanensis TaxID=2485998 RepID=UPI000F771ED8|nr:YoaK family protein [Lapidilactobacillus bayanensis]